MRGGVSDSFYVVSDNFSSSPHARGCFWASWWRTMTTRVFPACAGVFPGRPERVISPSGLPRMRGGVSEEKENKNVFAQSSPHARGCFSVRMAVQPSDYVFPACAGVFPDQRPARSPARGLPRMRGGVFALLFLPARVHMHHAVLDRGEGGFDRLVDAFGD